MSVVNFNTTYPGTAGGGAAAGQSNVSIPANAYNITVTVAGGKGGNGCQDGGPPQGNGQPGGSGRVGVFSLPNYTARTLTLSPGGSGQQRSSQCGGCNCAGGNVSGTGGGGDSGYTGGGGSSGAGGGGGAASIVYDSLAACDIIVAGGGGGGGGGSMGCDAGGGGGSADSFVAQTSGGVSRANGDSGGGALAGDGGSGGAGGGGTFGGGGGQGGADFCDPDTSYGGGGGGSGYRSNIATLTSEGANTGNGYINVTYTSVTPEITSFTASPNPQNSGSQGVPSSSTTFYWDVKDITSVKIYDGATQIINGGTTLQGNSTYNTGLQSVQGTNSPASKTYTLQACYNSICVTQNLIVNVRNDNTPNTFTIPSTATDPGGTVASLNNLEPNTVYTFFVGPITGIDMITAVNCSAGLDASLGGSTYSSTIYIVNNDTVKFRFTSDVFNSDPTGQKTAQKTYNFSIGSTSSSFSIQTRAPDVQETFDFGDNTGNFPYPDIDQVVNTPTQYLTSPTTVIVDDIEIATEIKLDNPDSEIRIKPQGSSTFGSWKNTRSI